MNRGQKNYLDLTIESEEIDAIAGKTVNERYLEKGRIEYGIFKNLDIALRRVNWIKLMMVLKRYGKIWKKKQVIKELYQNHRVSGRKYELSQDIELGKGV